MHKKWPSVSALVDAVGLGSSAAEAILVRKFGPGLMYVLLRETRNRDLAEDLYQEAFLVVIEKLRSRSLEEPEKLAGFLLGVARRLVLAHRRHEARSLDVPDALESLPDCTASPLELAIRAQEAHVLRAAIGRLAVPRDRELLLRRYLMDQEKKLICDVLRLDSQQFNRAMHRARSRLKEQINIVWQWQTDLAWES